MEDNTKILAKQGFYLRSPGIWIRHPISHPTSSRTQSGDGMAQNVPSLVLLFSWTGAAFRPTSKYTHPYITMFPGTPIVLVTSTVNDLTFRSSRRKQAVLAPAISYITSRHLDSNLHVHAFSEGGSHKAIQFATAYLSTTGRKLPVTSLCLDSTPGDYQYRRVARAFTLSLPSNSFIRFLGSLVAYLVVGGLWCFYYVYGIEKNAMKKIRVGLEDERLWDAPYIPRCYLYSTRDELIKWEDVETHAEQAERWGTEVHRVKFSDSGHCAHIKEDPIKYWDGVRWALRLTGSREEHEGPGHAQERDRHKPSAHRPMVFMQEIKSPEPIAQTDTLVGPWL